MEWFKRRGKKLALDFFDDGEIRGSEGRLHLVLSAFADAAMESQSGMSASVAALPVNRDEHRAIEILAELYSGFINEKAVAKDLAGLSTPVERLEEILRYRLHPALYTNLVWRGTGYESQQALTPNQLEEKLAAATEYSKMNVVTRFACDKFWTFGVQGTWQTLRDEIERIRARSS